MGDARKLPFESGQRLLVHPHGFSQPLVLANQIARLLFLDVLDVAASVLGLRSWDIRDCGTELPEFGKRVNDDLVFHGVSRLTCPAEYRPILFVDKRGRNRAMALLREAACAEFSAWSDGLANDESRQLARLCIGHSHFKARGWQKPRWIHWEPASIFAHQLLTVRTQDEMDALISEVVHRAVCD
jgi:hypothetical protein